MKKLLLTLILLYSTFLYAEIDERKSDVYFVNGIDTDEDSAEDSIIELRDETELNYSNAYKQIKEWKVNYNQTNGFEADIYETVIQKLYKLVNENKDLQRASVLAYVLDSTMGLIPGATGVVKDVLKYAGKKIGKVAIKKILLDQAKAALTKQGLKLSKEDIAFLSEKVFDGLIDELLNGIKPQTLKDIAKDVQTHFLAYQESIKNGHGIIIVSHSQGNFFTNFIVDGYSNKSSFVTNRPLIADWQKKYIHTFGVATPTSSIANGGNYITFDNDFVQSVPGSLPQNIHNPKRYKFTLEEGGQEIETRFSVKAHSFLSSYMATPSTQSTILKFIDSSVTKHNETTSQWKPENLGCKCKDKYVKLTHKYDSAHIPFPSQEKVKDYSEGDENGKIYEVDSKYLRGYFSGVSVNESEEDGVCFELKNEETSLVGKVTGINEDSTTKDGVVEIALKWNRPELDFDLTVAWDAGEVDVKDVCEPLEHFHIKSEKKIYPGTYQVFINPKDAGNKIFLDPSIYPIEVDLVTRTPGASDSMHFIIKNSTGIRLGHVSDIKVYRTEDEKDDNSDDPSDPSDDGSNTSGSSSSPAFYIAPQIAPECPPVTHTPSPVAPKPIQFTRGSSGGYSFYSGGGYGGGGGGGGGYSGGGSSGTFTIQQDPTCGGDLSCLPKPQDATNGNNDASGEAYAPVDPIVGGKPVRDLAEEDSCEGDSSCGCIPCEYEIIPYLKQIYFGPLRDAKFSIYSLDGYLSGAALYEGTTSKGKTLYDAGELDVPQEVLNILEDDKLYVIKAQGGEDIDSDDNFIVDVAPTKNLGQVYALASGEDIKYTGLKINILTTVTFELVQNMIKDGNSTQQIELKMQEIASRLLRYKVYPNSVDK